MSVSRRSKGHEADECVKENTKLMSVSRRSKRQEADECVKETQKTRS